MATPEERLDEAATLAENASAIATEWANGPENTFIETESGPLPTLAEFMRSKATVIDGAVQESALAEQTSQLQVGGVTAERIGNLVRGMRSVSWFDFGVVIGADSTAAFGNAVQYAAENNVKLRCEGGSITLSGSKEFIANGKDLVIEFSSGGGIQLANGAWASAPLVVYNLRRFIMRGLNFNGNRANTTGNNAGFAVLFNPNTVMCDDLRFTDLRRVGLNILSSSGNRVINRVELSNIYADNTGVSGAALGEVIKVENADNVTINGFTSLNTSGTGDGQMQKCFYCGVVTLKNFIIQDASPSLTYPAISNVRNDSLSSENMYIGGASQVSFEDNACLQYSYKNIRTSGRKAAIWSADGAEKPLRQAEGLVIENWQDTSSDALAFNFVGVAGIKLKNVSTNKDINISRDTSEDGDLRSSKVEFNDVSCNNLSTLLCQNFIEFKRTAIAGIWLNSSSDSDTLFIDSTYGTYSNGGEAAVRVATMNTSATGAQFALTIPASGTASLLLSGRAVNFPLAGQLECVAMFTGNFNQFSKMRFDFFSGGTAYTNKQVIMSGSTARSGVTIFAIDEAARKLNFASTEGVEILLFGTYSTLNAFNVING